jgi:hypothetical protein
MNAYRNGVKMFNDGPFEGFGIVVNSGSDSQFILPLKYGSGTARHELVINWGDGNVQTITGTAGITAQYQGLPHAYSAANRNYTIKITGTTYLTTAENDSYFGLGFYSGSNGYNAVANKAKIKKLLGTPDALMSASIPSKTYCYYNMFYACTGLTGIPATLLPATTLATYCYRGMFYGCTGITEIPATLLPATTLASSCYYNMFYGCTGLTEIPATLLPATTLVSQCYYNMFRNCTGLTEIPATLLPATTLAGYCYYGMFYACAGLTGIPATLLPATTLASSCYAYMFRDCTKLTFIYMTLSWFSEKTAQTSMFNGCTKITANTAYADIPTGWK